MLIALDLDGTLLGSDGQVSTANFAALKAAEQAGHRVVIATGRRHGYAMRVLRNVGLPPDNPVISSNGTVTRTIDAKLLDRTLLSKDTARWLCGHMDEFRNALVMTFDKVGPDGEDARGALVVEDLAELNISIGRWMIANEPYIQRIIPMEDALQGESPIQMMLCGTVERMRRAEARLLEHPGISAVGVTPRERAANAQAALHRTEYPERNLSIVDILPAGCSKGSALLRLAASHGLDASQILAIGDNWNDVSMLEIAGHAVLMNNAPEDLKALAAQKGWTLGAGHDDDGVARALETILSSRIETALPVTL